MSEAITKDQKILDLGKDRYKIAVKGWQHIYDESLNDQKFVYDIDDGQWPDNIKEVRKDRPMITANKLLKFVRQLRGEFKQNRPGMKVIPVDDAADVQMAELYSDLIRQIEYLSTAGVAYDTAYASSIASSVGFFRIITKYTNNNSFDQDLFIKRIINPHSVHFDPAATEFELEDAKYCFVEESIDKKEFEQKYPNADVINYEGNRSLFGEWMQEDKVKIAEYFYKEAIKKTIVQVDTGDIFELTKDITSELIQSKGLKIVRDRVVNDHKVMWCKINGVEILEKSEWLGKDIPIIPMFGDEIVIEGKKHYLSLIRGAKGQQQMYNYWASAATENVALSPKIPYMVDHRQIKGFEGEWEEAHKTNRPYLRYNAIPGLQKPEREQQSQIPAAIISMMQTTAFDIEDHLGRYESSKGQSSNERSGKAITARIQQSDKGSYTFVDNSVRSIICGLKQLIDLIPKVYDTKRALRIMGETGEEQTVNVNVPIMGGDGQIGIANDLSVGKYDLIASVGASFGSKRQEMVDNILQAMQYAPTVAPVLAPFLFKFADFPGAQEMHAEIMKYMEQMAQQQPQNK